MRLTRIEIKGFKSIAKRTVLTFPGAITCIAGPNGCGKSNIVDAIRWALGEQSARALRAGNMADVIFAGTQDIPPSGMASVSLEFCRDGGAFPKELTGFNEISIARRLFKSGESIYTINNVRCRLKDITDLFLDTGLDRQGYAIIEQGRVKDIILAKPEDIRHVLEEVAEVGKFRVKRAEAIKRLEAAQGNLDRIKDLLSEVSRQRDSLKAQAYKARRYQILKDKINGLTQLTLSLEIDGIRHKRAFLEDDLNVIEKGRQGVRDGLSSQASLLEEVNARMLEMKGDMDYTHATLQEVRARYEIARGEKDSGELRLKDTRSTIDMLSIRMENARKENEGVLHGIDACTRELEGMEGESRQIEDGFRVQKDAVDAIMNEFNAVSGDYERKRAILFDQIGHARAMEQRIGFLKQRHHEVGLNIRKREQELEEMAREEANLQAELAILDAGLEKLSRTIREKQDAIHTLMQESTESQAKIERDSQSLISLEKTHTELATKITMLGRIINRWPASPEGHENNGFKRVSDAIRVATGFEETAGSLGDVLDYLIINDHDEVIGPEGIRAQGPGFIPTRPHLDGHKEDASFQVKGLLGPLRAYVAASPGFEGVLEVLTRGKWVVKDMQQALKLWRQGYRSQTLITRDGMILESSGILRTSPEKDKYAEILKAKTESLALTEQMKALEGTLKEKRISLEEAKGKFGLLITALEGVSGKIKRDETEIEACKEKRHGILSTMERMTDRRKTFDHDILTWEGMSYSIAQDIEKADEEKKGYDTQVDALQIELKMLDTRKMEAKKDLDTVQGGLQTISERLQENKVAYASKEERLKGLKGLLGMRYQEIESDAIRIQELKEKEGELIASLGEMEQALISGQEEIKRQEVRYGAYLPQFKDHTLKAETIRKNMDELNNALTSLEKQKQDLMLSDKEQEIAYKMMLERYAARFGSGLPQVPEDFDPEKARAEIAQYQTRIEVMGQINFAAIESYEEAQTRFDELHKQYEDIVLASTRLRELIANIERESAKEFMATFAKVRANFQEIFTTMFGGGQADIVLQQGGGIDAGVEIFACPPFKRLKAMSLLSEGEKTLCAISFTFALFKVRPSPFCILDEVDAPLDDANLERFNRLIKAFSKDSQFLVVTHNKNTLEVADIIYGITFDVPGVTKVVSMDLQREKG